MPTAPSSVTRATVLRATVWSVPAVAVVAAASPMLQTYAVLFTAAGQGVARPVAPVADPVQNLTFTISGLGLNDSNGHYGYQDRVGIAPTPTGVDLSAGTTGSGTAADPFRMTTPNAEGQATVTLAGPLTSFTLRLDSDRGSAVSSVVVGGMTFQVQIGD